MVFRANPCRAALFLASALATTGADNASLSETRTALEKWVTTKQLIAGEKADWATEKETLQQTLALYERELKLLGEQIAQIDTGSEQAEKEQRELEQGKAELVAAMEALTGSVVKLEESVRRISRGFPPVLMNRLEPLFARLPEDSSNTKLSAIERMQTVIGVLNEVEKFNGAVTLETEVKPGPDGREVQVRTLYLGLGQAFFVDQTGKFAGVGVPGAEGWQWQAQPELASRIRQAIGVYENSQPADFVRLPLKVQ